MVQAIGSRRLDSGEPYGNEAKAAKRIPNPQERVRFLPVPLRVSRLNGNATSLRSWESGFESQETYALIG